MGENCTGRGRRGGGEGQGWVGGGVAGRGGVKKKEKTLPISCSLL